MQAYKIEHSTPTGTVRMDVRGMVGSVPAHGRLVIAHRLYGGDTDRVRYVGMDRFGQRLFEEVTA